MRKEEGTGPTVLRQRLDGPEREIWARGTPPNQETKRTTLSATAMQDREQGRSSSLLVRRLLHRQRLEEDPVRRWQEVSSTHTSTAGQAMLSAEVDAATVKRE